MASIGHRVHEEQREMGSNTEEGKEGGSISSPSPSPALDELECHASGINTTTLAGSDIKSQSSFRKTLAVPHYMVAQ